MVGDQQDMLARLRSSLPTRWFPDEAPLLDGLLNGLASAWSYIHDQLHYLKAQTRMATATGIWLDIIAHDYFGNRVTRRNGQNDAAFRSRIGRELFRERGTREALISALSDLTGRTPDVFESGLTGDTGAYSSLRGGGGGIAYGLAGGWGSLHLPFQCFITAYRPTGSGIALVSGWCGSSGGYGQGSIQYASLAMVQGQVTDADIYKAVADILPIATTGWTKINN